LHVRGGGGPVGLGGPGNLNADRLGLRHRYNTDEVAGAGKMYVYEQTATITTATTTTMQGHRFEPHAAPPEPEGTTWEAQGSQEVPLKVIDEKGGEREVQFSRRSTACATPMGTHSLWAHQCD
jgi:hypothetical protein